MLKDWIVPLAVPLVGGTVAVFWPWLQARQRGRKFERIIKRELAEIGPFQVSGDPESPWWQHLRKRFIHEEIFEREQVSGNKDFILSLHPAVIYAVNQLWIAFDKHDGDQWLYYLDELAKLPQTSSPDLEKACTDWKRVMRGQKEPWRHANRLRGDPAAEPAIAGIQGLFDQRLNRYSALLALTENVPGTAEDRQKLSKQIRQWYYTDGAGLLLSGRALRQFLETRDALADSNATEAEVALKLSLLRTDLKIDLGVRHPDERFTELALPLEERT
ncbi:hypothetical protein [Terrabacter sp. Root181]|uniref:hypothetical protein n=1 Tax=Terrabacter sp. Root181 TaxID=1736484 RepID=UPI0006FDD154|nr:hypothetical protein [Terrabacter sp. Root181]KRB43021.1 hypothetical protein ASD90_21785 [Terrabacter sp. Root181]